MSGLPASLRFGPSPPKHVGASRLPGGSSGKAGSRAHPQQQSDNAMAAAAAAWQAEYERVAAHLVITAPADSGGEWRPQLERALAVLGGLQAAVPVAQTDVEGAGRELAGRIEELAASEAAASTQLAELYAEHEQAVEAVEALQKEHVHRQEYVATLEQELQFLNKELEERQQEVTEQGESMSDTRPVARLEAACKQLREELGQMDVRAGVLQAALLRTQAAKPAA